MSVDDRRAALRGRYAVGGIFLVNGFLIGSWALQIPATLTRLAITEFTLGLLILGFGLGALVAMPVCGAMTGRYGTKPVVATMAIACAFGLLLVALSPHAAVAAVALFVFGALTGGTDVAMNANAVEVEKRLGRAVMSSSHGFWSLGGFIGGGIGGWLIESFGSFAHAAIVTAIALAATLVSVAYLMAEARPAKHEAMPFRLPSNPVIYLIGVIALFSMIPEGAVLDWAALYLKQERGADLATAGFGFAAFSGAMAVMRFAGDGVRGRFGAVMTLRVSALVAAAGMLVAAFAPSPWIAIAAFAVSGLGIANTVPIAFSAAGNQKGTHAGAALSVVTVMGYSGILVAPSGIGFVGERVGFAPVYVAVAGLLLIVALIAGYARSAEFVAPSSHANGAA